MKVFNGKKESEKILSDLKRKINRERIKPGLAAILVGEDPASKLYVKLKRRAAKKTGIGFVLHKFSADAENEKIIQRIERLNKIKSVHGILVQLPLPKRRNADKIIQVINSEKNVDKGVLPSAIFFALKKGMKDFKGRKIVALVNSEFFGETLKEFFLQKGVKIEYILRKSVLSGEAGAVKRLKSSDAIITVCGCHKLVRGDIIKRGAVLIDAGIPADVDRESVKNKAVFLTPVPGGIGPLTVSLLLKNVYHAAKYSKNNRSNLS